LKLLEDALQAAGFYVNDAQIVGGEVAKRYGDPPGYRIQLTPVLG
jgi:Holliday junction resolvase RusA-like endonuclease